MTLKSFPSMCHLVKRNLLFSYSCKHNLVNLSWCFLFCFLMKRKLNWRSRSAASMSDGAFWQFCQKCHLGCWKLLALKLKNVPSEPRVLLQWLACCHPPVRCPSKKISLSDFAYKCQVLSFISCSHKVAFLKYTSKCVDKKQTEPQSHMHFSNIYS